MFHSICLYICRSQSAVAAFAGFSNILIRHMSFYNMPKWDENRERRMGIRTKIFRKSHSISFLPFFLCLWWCRRRAAVYCESFVERWGKIRRRKETFSSSSPSVRWRNVWWKRYCIIKIQVSRVHVVTVVAASMQKICLGGKSMAILPLLWHEEKKGGKLIVCCIIEFKTSRRCCCWCVMLEWILFMLLVFLHLFVFCFLCVLFLIYRNYKIEPWLKYFYGFNISSSFLKCVPFRTFARYSSIDCSWSGFLKNPDVLRVGLLSHPVFVSSCIRNWSNCSNFSRKATSSLLIAAKLENVEITIISRKYISLCDESNL